jgi:glycosyltransferase involved in cell wall biosynthesis
MRIGLLTTSFPRHEGDVAGTFVLGFARALAMQGHGVEVLAPEPREPVQVPSWPGVDVHWVPSMRPRRLSRTFYGAGVPDNLRTDPLAWLGLAPFTAGLLGATLARRARWDALVSHWALPCGLVAGSARGAMPHLCIVHSADLHLLSRLPLRAALAERLVRNSSRVLFVSDEQRARFVGWLDTRTASAGLHARCEVQPMGIDDRSATADRTQRALLREELGLRRFTLLTVARLVAVKGLAEAIASLGERDDLEWLIAGDGPERSRLQALAARTRLRVRLLGTVTGKAKRELLAAADAFVLPSRVLPSGRSEGVPTALLEAMAHGLPVIASEVGGIAQVVRHMQSGLLFDPGVPGALEDRIDQLRSDQALARALTTSGHAVAERHHWRAIAPRLDRMLHDPPHI